MSNADGASSMAMSNCAKSSAATICARAAPDAGFKASCMRSGGHDGSNRNHYFQGVAGVLLIRRGRCHLVHSDPLLVIPYHALAPDPESRFNHFEIPDSRLRGFRNHGG